MGPLDRVFNIFTVLTTSLTGIHLNYKTKRINKNFNCKSEFSSQMVHILKFLYALGTVLTENI